MVSIFRKRPTKGKWSKEEYLNSNSVSSNQENVLNNHVSRMKSNLKNQEPMKAKYFNIAEEGKPLNTDAGLKGN